MSFGRYLNERPTLFIFLVIFILCTLLANVFVAMAIIFNKKLHNTTSFYILSTSLTGMVISFLNMPFETIYVIENYNWNYGLPLCILWYTLDLSNCSINLSSFTIVSYIRFKSITSPNKPWAKMWVKIVILVHIWALPLLMWSLVNGLLMTSYPPDSNNCFCAYSNYILITLIVVMFVCPLIGLLAVNFFIMYELHLRVKKMKQINPFSAHANVTHHCHHHHDHRSHSNSIQTATHPSGKNSLSVNKHPNSSNRANNHDENNPDMASNTNAKFNFTKEKKALISLIFIQISLVVCWTPYIVILPLVSSIN